MNISKADRKRILSIIEKDVKFLEQNELIDYSMLIGIEIINFDNTPEGRERESGFSYNSMSDAY